MRIKSFVFLSVALCSFDCVAQGLHIREEREFVNGGWQFTQDFPIAKYSRFVGGNDFVGRYEDLSGVGRGTMSPPGPQADHGTMISGSFFLAAHHGGAHPQGPSTAFPNGEILRFYYKDVTSDLENPANYLERYVTSNWEVGNINGHVLTGDLEAGKLNIPVSSNIAVYPVLFLPTLADYAGIKTLFTGKSMPVHLDANQRGLRAGYRTTGFANTFSIHFVWDSSFPESVLDFITGDSGSPSFATELPLAWGPVLAGIHWGYNNTHSNSAITTTEARDALQRDIREAQPTIPMQDQEVPVFFTNVTGDYNGNFALDAGDIDIIVRETRFYGSRGYNWYLDYTGDRQTTNADVDVMLAVVGFFRHPAMLPIKRGDANLDGTVGIDDAVILGANWGLTNRGWAEADFNGDGTVDGFDEDEILNNWDE